MAAAESGGAGEEAVALLDIDLRVVGVRDVVELARSRGAPRLEKRLDRRRWERRRDDAAVAIERRFDLRVDGRRHDEAMT